MTLVRLEPATRKSPNNNPELKFETSQNEEKQPLYASRSCPVCGNVLLIPSGSCFVCQVCGTSNGCG